MTNKQLKDLVKQLQEGDISVFDDIYYETKSVVYYTIFLILKDSDVSQDIMQDTYLQMLKKIHSYKPFSSFKSWLVMIARNLAFNEFNRRKREMMVDISEDEYIFGSVENNSENELLVKEMIESLKPIERQIVVMHIIGDLKHREIAKILDKPLGTVTWTYNEALKKLRNKYGE